MSILEIKKGGAGKYDLVALSEIMLRLDPGEGRVRTAREFKVWEGGGEYNVARGLRRCFGLRRAVSIAFKTARFAGKCAQGTIGIEAPVQGLLAMRRAQFQARNSRRTGRRRRKANSG
jgi:hypothetical protein